MPKPVCSKSASILPLGHFVFTLQNCKAGQSAHSLASLASRSHVTASSVLVPLCVVGQHHDNNKTSQRLIQRNASWTDERISQMLDVTHKKFIKSRLKIFINKENTFHFFCLKIYISYPTTHSASVSQRELAHRTPEQEKQSAWAFSARDTTGRKTKGTLRCSSLFSSPWKCR